MSICEENIGAATYIVLGDILKGLNKSICHSCTYYQDI